MANQGNGADMTRGNFSGTSQLNTDLLIQILVRLPVLSILRFKSVCKAWYALFSTSNFIQHHSRVASSSAQITDLMSLFIHTEKTEGNGHIFSLFRDLSCGNPVVITLNPPFRGDLEDVKVVGSINGLVCLDLYNNATSILLWNPATRKHSQIPNPQLLSLASDERVSIGFAYDEKTDSYKVIRILESKVYAKIQLPVKVEIYSTKTNTWRAKVVADFPSVADQKTCGAVVNGSPYWYAYEHQDPVSRQVILWFDASVEAFRFQPLKPMQLGHFWCRKIGFGGMGENPVAFCCKFVSFKGSGSTVLDMWKLNKCDDGGSDVIEFEKLMIKPISGIVTIAGFGRKGEIIASDLGENLIIYDPHSEEMKCLPGGGCWGLSPKVCDYTETLVSPSMAT